MNNEEIEQIFTTILQGQKKLQIAQVNLTQRTNELAQRTNELAQGIEQTNNNVNSLINTINSLAQVTQNHQVSIQRITGEGLIRDADLSLNNQRFIRIEQRLERIENLLRGEDNN